MATSWAALAAMVPVPSYSAAGRKIEATGGNVQQAKSFLTQEGSLSGQACFTEMLALAGSVSCMGPRF